MIQHCMCSISILVALIGSLLSAPWAYAQSKPVVVSVEEKLPPVGCRVIVVCERFRCLGYVDRHGIWRDDAGKRELHDVIGWVEC